MAFKNIGIWIIILCESDSNPTLVKNIMGFVSFKERGVGYLPHWNVGHARQARWRINGVQGSEHSASSPEPCRQLRSPFTSPTPGDGWLRGSGEKATPTELDFPQFLVGSQSV